MKRFLFLSLMLMTVGIMWSSENAPVLGVAENQTRDDDPYETPAPVLSYELTDYAMIFTATGEGTVTLYIQYIDNWTGGVTNEQYSDYGVVSVEVPRDYETTYVNVWASAQANDAAVPGVIPVQYYIEIPAQEMPPLITPCPEFTTMDTGESIVVVVSGEGYICLYQNGEFVADGEGSITYEIPYVDEPNGEEYVFSATAQVDGWEMSEYTYWVVFVPGVPADPYVTPAPVLQYDLTDDAMYFTATGEGTVTLYIQLIDNATGEMTTQSVSGEEIVVYAIPRDYEDTYVNVWATAQANEDAAIGSTEVEYYVEIPAIEVPYETPAPEWTYNLTDYSMVFTAVGEGTVTLYIQFIDNATGEMTTESFSDEGSVVFEIPRGSETTYVNVWATAQANENALIGYTEVEYYVEIPAMVTVIPGDADGDGKVTVNDVTAIIDYVLGVNVGGINVDGADFNNDGQVAISDVTAIIDYIMHNN